MNFNLREKHKEWYCVVTFRDENNKRKERWVPLKLLVKEGKKKEAKSLVDAISQPGAFDPNSLSVTNATLGKLNLYLFDDNWRPMRNGPTTKMGRPRIYVDVKDLTPGEIAEGQMGLKKGKKILFGDYLVIWFNIHKENVALNTVASLKGQVFHIIGPWFNAQKVTLSGIQPEDIEAFYREKQADGVSNNTLRHYHGTIRSALQYAFKRGYVISNVADRVDKPKKEIFKGSFYNEDELKKLFSAVKGTNLEFAVYMAAYYGLRREEVCGLRWEAVDFQYKTITIKHTVSEVTVDGKFQLLLKDTTKNKSSFRTLPLSDSTISMLLEMKERQEKMQSLFGNRYNHGFDDYIYCFENGDLVRPNWVTYSFRKLLDDNGMRRIRFHDLRHSCATLLRHEGVRMEDISKWLGHSNTLTTEQVYAHYDEAAKDDTLKAISNALDEKGKEMD